MKKVAIITRTKNRPLLLARAYRSIENQTFKDFVWVVVNDGGDARDVESILTIAGDSGSIDVQVIHNVVSQDRGEALNIGIKNSESRYIAIHDDDDSWHHDFLQKTISVLEDPEKNIFDGIVTRCHVVEESIDFSKERVFLKRKYPHNAELSHVTLFGIAKLNNNFPPISFVYRRNVHDSVKFFRKDLTVLEDWDFYLRFLVQYNICVLPEYLANYHIRVDNRNSPEYSNTVTDQINVHKERHALLLNEYLRDDLGSKKVGFGFLTNIAYEISETQRLIRRNSLIQMVKNIINMVVDK